MKPDFSIVLLTYNRKVLLRAQLNSLQKVGSTSHEIIVVDNCSEDGTKEMVSTQFSNVTYIRTDRNRGVSARNLGMHASRGEFIITLDDDVVGITDKDLITLREIFGKNPDIGAVNFKVVNPQDGTLCNWVHHCPPEEFQGREFATYEITEGAVAFRRKVLEKSGYYPEEYFISHEGPDLAFRIIEKGYKVIYSHRICVEHFHSNEGRAPWRNYYYDTRNQFLLAKRHFPFLYACGYLARGLAAMLIYSVRDGYYSYWIKGVRDGIRMAWESREQRKVLRKKTMNIIKSIDANRSGFIYLYKKRILQKDISILK